MSEFNMEKIKGIEHLSKMYNAEQIRYVLGMSKSNVYRFLEEVYKNGGPFVVVKIGRLYRVKSDSFDEWYKTFGKGD